MYNFATNLQILCGVIYKPTISEMLKHILWSIKVSPVNVFLIKLELALVLWRRELYWKNENRSCSENNILLQVFEIFEHNVFKYFLN